MIIINSKLFSKFKIANSKIDGIVWMKIIFKIEICEFDWWMNYENNIVAKIVIV